MKKSSIFFLSKETGGEITQHKYVSLNQLSMFLIIVHELFLMILLALFSVMLPYEPEPHTV